VLEAVKLILERRIFVTFLGLDARVLARAVEDRYKNVLPHSDHPGGAGMEYLEKIIQLPFWIKSGDMKAYVDSLIGGEFDDVAGAAVIPGTLRHEETFETMRAGEDWQTRLGEALEGFHAPERVTLGPDDRNHFGVYAKFFPDNPRAAKRIVNLYRFGKSLGPPDDLNEAMLKWIIVGDRWPHFADFVHLHPNSYKEGDPSTMWSRVLSEFRTSRNGQDPPAALQEILSTGILISPSMLRQIEPYVVNVCPVSQLWPASASAAARQPSQAPY
ncbi:MAG: hypothetical protein IIB23_04020, partial [Chloroflexi bacterium]|nr:hypothetical protein [Chloroflexota bacterium]